MYELNVRCNNCTRFIPLKASRTSAIEVRCNDRKCKAWNKVKVVMLSDMVGQPHSHEDSKTEAHKKTLEDLKAKAEELDGRTKEAKELKAQIEELQKYITQLEGIVDGQG